jgi:hypothetical protein
MSFPLQNTKKIKILTTIELQLEELDEIFNSRHPVSASIARKRLGFDAYGDVVNIQEI